MLFSSYIFIFVFLPIVWFVFHTIKALSFSHSYTLAKIFLVLSSLFFYAYWKLSYLPILLSSIALNYCFATWILACNTHTTKTFLLKAIRGGGYIKSL